MADVFQPLEGGMVEVKGLVRTASSHVRASDTQDAAAEFWTAYPEGCYVMMGDSNVEIVALVMKGEITDEERLRRARLMAAAPDLLGALQVLVAEANRLGPQLPYNAPTADIASAIDRARSAIAKAIALP